MTEREMARAAWWQLFDTNLAALRDLVAGFYPIGSKSSPDFRITAGRAEQACEAIRAEIAVEGVNPVVAFDAAAVARDGRALVTLLSRTWFGIPESADSRSLPGFFRLCDLIEEGQCHLEDEEEWPEE